MIFKRGKYFELPTDPQITKIPTLLLSSVNDAERWLEVDNVI